LLVRNAVGGQFTLPDLNVTFQVGEVLDLTFFADRRTLATSRELRRALEKHHLEVIDQRSFVAAARNNFSPPRLEGPVVALPSHPAVRRAIFVDGQSPHTNMSYAGFSLRDRRTRRMVVSNTRDVNLLQQIVEMEPDETIVAVATSRLEQLHEGTNVSARVS